MAFLNRAAGDNEEVLAVGFGKTTVALGDVSRDGQSNAVEFVNEKAISAGKLLGGRTNIVGKVQGLLVNEELLELESHFATPKK